MSTETVSKLETPFKPSTRIIKSVRVVTTGSVDIHPEHIYGSHKPAMWWIFASKQWVNVPISVFIIEHRDGLVLFDTGMNMGVITNPHYFPSKVTELFMDHIFKFHMNEEDTLTAQLNAAGYSASDVKKAVISHLHFDHVGGISEIPQAELVVCEKGWQHMLDPKSEKDVILRDYIETPGANWHRIRYHEIDDSDIKPFKHAYDLMGDGSMLLLPTPGHLPGSLSMLVRRENSPPLLLVGDLTYYTDLLMQDNLPGTGDHKLLLNSFAKVRELKQRLPDLLILPTHDWSAVEILD
jgi:glyoxylase-like metal-dependent hydrolase (beta-lactamase superfamily II)